MFHIVSASGSHGSKPVFSDAKSIAEGLIQKGEPWAEVRQGEAIKFATDASQCCCPCVR